ncbi:hypothetical protein Tco_0584446 [Tanacetum coccineum]
MAFVSSPSSINEVNTANVYVSTANSSVSTDSTLDSTANLSDATIYAFLANQPNGSQLVHEDLEQIHEDDLEEMNLKWQLALLSMRARRYYQRTGKKITMNGSDTAGYDKSKVSDCDEDDFEVMVLKSDNVQHKPEQANQPKKVSQNLRNNRTKWNEIKTQKLGVGFQITKKACFVCGSFNHLIKDCDLHDKNKVQKPVLNNVKKGTSQKKVRPVWNNAMRVNHQNFSNSRRNFIPTTVLTKSGIVPVSAAMPINTAAPKSFVNAAKTRPNAFQKSHSLSRRPFYQQTSHKNKNLNDKVNTAKINSVNTAKGNRVTSSVGEQGINVVKFSACWVWRPKIKPTRSEEFHQIVDFLAGSHIRYALTANPTIYVSLIEQFWQTVTVDTVNDGEQQLTVIVDGTNKLTITDSIYRMGHLQLGKCRKVF